MLDLKELDNLLVKLEECAFNELLAGSLIEPQNNVEDEEIVQEQKNPEPDSKRSKTQKSDKKYEKEEESEDENRNQHSF